jgi:hypothetical protein
MKKQKSTRGGARRLLKTVGVQIKQMGQAHTSTIVTAITVTRKGTHMQRKLLPRLRLRR